MSGAAKLNSPQCKSVSAQRLAAPLRAAPASPAAHISPSLAAPRYSLSRPFAAPPNLFLMTL